jgi:hypothetical protein
MKKREFNRLCKTLCGKDGLFDKEKINQADSRLKNSLISFLVREREAIIIDFVNKETDMDWLGCMGYFYYAKNKHFSFLCTSENQIGILKQHEKDKSTA